MTGNPATRATVPLSEPIKPGRRGAARVRLALPARVVSFDGSFACTLIDASQSGAQIAAGHPLKPGAMVVIEMRGQDLEDMAGITGFADEFGRIEFFGTINWARGERFGIKFDEAVGRELVVMLRRVADIIDRSDTRWARERAREFVAGRN